MSKYQRTPAELEREIDMMKNPPKWPCWPFLPVKRASDKPAGIELTYNFPDLGVMTIDRDGKVEPIVYEGNITGMAIGTEKFDRNKVLGRYDSIEKIVEDGWVVD